MNKERVNIDDLAERGDVLPPPSHMSQSARPFLSAVALVSLLLVMLCPQNSHGFDATWSATPFSGNWDNATNWVPMTVPDSGTATFNTSTRTALYFTRENNVREIVFNAGASAFTFTSDLGHWLVFYGIGITNNSNLRQNFVARARFDDEPSSIRFLGSASAGNLTMFTVSGGMFENSTGSSIEFYENSTAGNATLIANDGSTTATSGGVISFLEDSTGGTARFHVFGLGLLAIAFHSTQPVTIGSLEGDGSVFVGRFNLTIGSNHLSTIFSGTVEDEAPGASPTGLTKIGTGTLRLNGASRYENGTDVNAGRLLANNASGSGTGSGAVMVNGSGSVVGGTGTISGPVTVNANGALLGGDATTTNGALKLAGNLALNSGSIVELVLGAGGAHSSITRTGGTWAFAPNQRFTFLDLGAQPGFYDNIITGLAGNPGGTASWVITNAGFTGAFTYDGAGNIDLNLTAASGPALQLGSAVSRKMHGVAGTFDILLPLSDEPGVECRNGNGNHTLVFVFTNNVVSGNASVTTGTGVAGSPTFTGTTMTVPLTGVADVQKITVTLSSVRDALSQILPDKAVKVNMLIGDTNGNRTVNATDIGQTKGQSGAPANGTNFRNDINASGSVNATDIGQVKANAGHTLPPEV